MHEQLFYQGLVSPDLLPIIRRDLGTLYAVCFLPAQKRYRILAGRWFAGEAVHGVDWRVANDILATMQRTAGFEASEAMQAWIARRRAS